MTQHLFYDTETTGPNPTYDQILQAAGILTDDDFREIDSFDIRSRLVPHIVPTAGALIVTDVDPFEIARAASSAYEFTRQLHDIFSNWPKGDLVAFGGYNTIRYDEEILRQGFWQNLLDPYVTSGRGKTRTDYLVMVRALHARNPDAIDFPIVEATGKKNFKLENIAPLNGFQDHSAHDALGDVRATIFMARLIRDTDPHLFQHMLAMGNANAARDFVDETVVFRLLGGPMLDPGILDCCLIASERSNPKNKTAWNLAIDPTPFLDLSAEAIVEEMKKPNTPFRSVKCNKQPAVFPMGWGFFNRVSNDAFEPADPGTIDARAEMILAHDAFRANVSEALRLKADSYDAPEALEEKIYNGFPSWNDKNRMTNFHAIPDWSDRLALVRQMEKPEIRSLGLRLVHANAPEALEPTLRARIDEKVADERFGLSLDKPWTTVGTLMAELDRMQADTPDDPRLGRIRDWALETYPAAREWTGEPRNPAIGETGTENVPEDTPAGADDTEPSIDAAAFHASLQSRTPQAAHFLDGLD